MQYFLDHCVFCANSSLVCIGLQVHFCIVSYAVFLFCNQTVKHFELYLICLKGAI